MTTVIGLKASRILEIVNLLVSGVSIVDDHLIITKRDGSTTDLGSLATVDAGVSTVDGLDGPVVLTDKYLQQKYGSPEPAVAETVGVEIWTPDLSQGSWFELLRQASGLEILMPDVAGYAAGKKIQWWLRLINDAPGGFDEPFWDANTVPVGPSRGAQTAIGWWDLYTFITVTGADDPPIWLMWHLTTNWDPMDNYMEFIKSNVPGTWPAADHARLLLDDDDKVLKVQDEHFELHHAMFHVGPTPPTNTNLIWFETA